MVRLAASAAAAAAAARMSFPLGRVILVMLLISAASGAVILSRPRPRRADLTVWVFADAHARSYREPAAGRPSLAEQYEHLSGRSVRVDQISTRALDVRLQSLFNSRRDDAALPDLVEVEINSVGKFFRPPLEHVGFLPLNGFIDRDGLMREVVAARFAPWSKAGVIFGIPRDVHPVAVVYRKDLFDEAGIDLAAARTWDAFHTGCLDFQRYQSARGAGRHRAFEMQRAKADLLTMMLLQRGANLIDDRNQVHLDDPKVLDTLLRYVRMAAGPRRIGAETTTGANLWVRDLAAGDVCAVVAADWRVTDLRSNAPAELAGKLALMPLPRFEPSDARTSTWGGTMLGIPRRCKDPAASWRLLKFLALSDEGIAARQARTDILPPTRAHWSDPFYRRPDPFFVGRPPGAVFADLAGEIPPRQVTPFTIVATEALGMVLDRSVRHFERHGEDGWARACQGWLDEAAADVRGRIAFGTFEQ